VISRHSCQGKEERNSKLKRHELDSTTGPPTHQK
jgi:hypothetical protein